MKKKVEIEWNYNLDEAPESELLLITRVNLYGTPEVFTAHKWYGRWVNEHGNDLQWKPYAWAKYPKPATRPKTKKG